MVSMTRRRALAGGIQLAAGAGLFVHSAPAIAQTAKTLTIGGTVPLSGAVANIGQNVYDGYSAVVNYVNDKLGGFKIGEQTYQLKLSMIDDQSDPQRAVALIQKQIDDGTNFFLGSYTSAVVVPSVALIQRTGKLIVQAGGSSDSLYTQGYRNNFMVFPRASRQGVAIAQMVKGASDKIRTVSVLMSNDSTAIPFTESMTKALEEAGLKILTTYRVARTAVDVSGVVTSIRENTPDILLTVVHEEQGRTVLQQLISTGTNLKAAFFLTGPETATHREAFGKYAEGLLTQMFWLPDVAFEDPIFGSSVEYVKYYNATMKRALSYQTVAGSLCVICLVKALQAARSIDQAKVRDALASLDFVSIYGRVKFTPEGDADPVLMGPKIAQIQGGQPKLVYPRIQGGSDFQFPMAKWNERA